MKGAPRRVSGRITHVRWCCWAALLFPVFGLFSPGIQNVDVKSISVDVFETVGEAGEAEGNKGRSGHAGSFDQFDLSVKRFNDSTFIFLQPKTNHDLPGERITKRIEIIVSQKCRISNGVGHVFWKIKGCTFLTKNTGDRKEP